MILTQQDIDEFVVHAEAIGDDDDPRKFFEWLSDHPQLFVASGFQEFVAAQEYNTFQRLRDEFVVDDYARPLFRDYRGAWVLPFLASSEKDVPWLGYRIEGLQAVRDTLSQLSLKAQSSFGMYFSAEKNGDKATAQSAYLIYSETVDELNRLNKECEIALPSINDMVNIASKYINNPLADRTLFVSPRLWTPENQHAQKVFLQSSITDLIVSIQQQKRELDAISWQEFEEMVAEVLRSKGMSIHLVKESPQGGRDILGRFQIGPTNEIATIAIEVKHRSKVDRPILQQSLYQNRAFPALMLVTSGRFTSGVVQEAAKPENRMRVFLKDGVAIRDMISSYSLARK